MSLSMETMTCIEDLRQAASRKVPRAFFDFVDGGSYTERTLQANCADFERIKLRQRVLIDVANRGTRSTILGEPVSLPLALAPVGLCGMLHRDGEILACRAAQAAGIPFCLSTMSVCSIEDVAAAVEKPFWFQMFFMKDRGFVRSLVERAAAAKCNALVVTLDLPAIGQRHRDIRNGMGMPPKPRFKTMLDIASKPAWAFGIARGKRRTLGNLAGQIRGADSLEALSQWIGSQFNAPLSWKDVEWLAGLWPGKLILKGILDVEDARIAAKTGVAALVVSNHGGRQLDGAPSSISVLPAIADSVGSCIEILFDGGIRSGHDIMRAIALGARACLSGRAYIYGLGAGGQAGVTRAIKILRNELDDGMALTGVTSVADIDRRVIAGV
jgi:L-lactate dehydrogenase (cytochrome)